VLRASDDTSYDRMRKSNSMIVMICDQPDYLAAIATTLREAYAGKREAAVSEYFTSHNRRQNFKSRNWPNSGIFLTGPVIAYFICSSAIVGRGASKIE
jgi:precorrin-6B methylase 1